MLSAAIKLSDIHTLCARPVSRPRSEETMLQFKTCKSTCCQHGVSAQPFMRHHTTPGRQGSECPKHPHQRRCGQQDMCRADTTAHLPADQHKACSSSLLNAAALLLVNIAGDLSARKRRAAGCCKEYSSPRNTVEPAAASIRDWPLKASSLFQSG